MLGDLPQHGVHELGPSVAEHHPRQFDAGGDGGVGGDAGAEQLVRAEREHVEHGRVDLAQRAVDAGGDDGVVRALAAQRPVHQLGREGRVPSVEVPGLAGLAQERRQHQVRVGVPLVDRPQRLEGEHPDRVLLGLPVGLGGTATCLLAQKVLRVTK